MPHAMILSDDPTDGPGRATPAHFPLDTIGVTSRHLTAGLAVDGLDNGPKAHLAVTYYYWPNAGCTVYNITRCMWGHSIHRNTGATWS